MPDSKKIRAPEALRRMLQRHELNSLQDYKNAIKEIVQEIALLGLWRAKFFERAAFYGGTALRILHGLDRFSEDLDFTLLQADPNFDLSHYEKAIQDELQSLGFTAHVEKKQKLKSSAVDSAFIKLNTIQHLILVGIPEGLDRNIHAEEILKIRVEVDKDPPTNDMETTTALLLLPAPFSVKTLRLEALFSGKMHAVLCREWKGRVKGRDWYDFVWFVSRGIRLNINYLENRMRQSGHWLDKKSMTEQDLSMLMVQRIETLDVEAAKRDVINFIRDSSQIALWSKEFFLQIAAKVLICP